MHSDMASAEAYDDNFKALEQAAKQIGHEIVKTLSALPLSQRSARALSILKPPPGNAALPDVLGEEVAWGLLAEVSARLHAEIRVTIDHAAYHPIKDPGLTSESGLHIWCYLDAVDGTVKLAGLGNENGRLRSANDGAWAVGIAFTEPTTKPLGELLVSDFKVKYYKDLKVLSWHQLAMLTGRLSLMGPLSQSMQISAITDGTACHASLSKIPPFPRQAIATARRMPIKGHPACSYVTWEGVGAPAHDVPCTVTLHTSTNQLLSQSFVYLDAFQVS
jgi:hypothetical protein